MADLRTGSFKLSPSDFAFAWEECPRCFFFKVVEGQSKPWSPFPGIFKKIDVAENSYFAGRSTQELSPALPPGVIEYGEKWVQSGPLVVPGHSATVFIRGRFDIVGRFDNGTFGVADFKTTETKDKHVPFYARQLHGYTVALENPAPNYLGLSPISRMGLFCLDPGQMVKLNGANYGLELHPSWIEIERDDGAFMRFLREVLDVLTLPEAPAPGPDCSLCRYLANNGFTR